MKKATSLLLALFLMLGISEGVNAQVTIASDDGSQTPYNDGWSNTDNGGSGFDAWAEWRRTGMPSLTPATDAINDGNIPTRYLYPTEEATLNGSNYSSAVSRLTGNGDKGTSKVWWDQ